MDEIIIDTTPFSYWTHLLYAAVAFAVLIFLIWVIFWLKKRWTRPELTGLTREQIALRWTQIRETSKQSIMGAKLAILEADTLLDSGLKSMMMPGDTLGERLKVACYKYPKLRDVWWAHKLRNSLAHESTFQISTRQAEQAMNEFEKALKTLNVL